MSDIVLRRPLGAVAHKSMELWTGCIAGALVDTVYKAKLEAAGFTEVGIEPTRIYDREATREMAEATRVAGSGGLEVDLVLGELDGAVMSAFVRATKPHAS